MQHNRLGLRSRAVITGGIGAISMAVLAVVASAAASAAPTGHAATGHALTGHALTGHALTGHALTGHATTAAAKKPLAGKIIGIDPGHNGRNWTDPSFLNKQIWNGRELEDCDTTGTQTAGGYTEAKFNFIVASRLAKILRKDGAKVVMTRKTNDGIGPCVNRRARILDKAHAKVSIDIHADYGPSTGRGFTVLEPVADGPNDKVVKPSLRFGKDVHLAFTKDTPMGISNYYGHNGYISRNDLAGLNLTTMPKVLIECGNMNNRADAKLLTSLKVEHEIARALSIAITRFLAGH